MVDLETNSNDCGTSLLELRQFVGIGVISKHCVSIKGWRWRWGWGADGDGGGGGDGDGDGGGDGDGDGDGDRDGKEVIIGGSSDGGVDGDGKSNAIQITLQ